MKLGKNKKRYMTNVLSFYMHLDTN